MTQELKIRLALDGATVVRSGIDGVTSSLPKLEDGLNNVVRPAEAAGRSLNNMGLSAKQTAAALRGVPAQFTDIFTSLAAGQAPMTVFLQQGGQLKDMFGGAGNAAKALGGYVKGMVNPFTLAAAAVGTLAYAYDAGASEAQQMAKAIILTGNAAGTSVNHLKDVAASVAAATGATQGALAEALAQIVQSGKVSEASLAGVAEAAVRMERATGQSIGETVKQFESLAKSPVEASAKLNEQYNYLTAAVYLQIKALADQGKESEAVALAQSAFAEATSEMARKVDAQLGTLEKGWKDVKDGAKSAWDAMLDIGREDSLLQKLAKANEDVAKGGGWFGGLEEARARQAVLIAAVEQELLGNDAKAEGNRLAQASIEWSKQQDKYLSKRESMTREINKAEALGVAAGASRVEIEKQIAAIREKYADKKTGTSQAVKDAEALATVMDRLTGKDVGLDASYWKELDTLFKAYKRGALDATEYADAVDTLTSNQKFNTDANKAAEAAARDQAKAEEEYARALYAADDALVRKAEQLEYEVQYYGMTESAINAVIVTQLERARAMAAENGAYPEHLAFLDREIEARQRIASASGQKEVLDANDKAAKEAAKDWEKASDDINRALTDALMRGFEDGKSFGQNFVDSLRNSLKTAGLKIVVNTVTGALGLSGAGSAAANGGSGSGSSWLGVANDLSSLNTAYGAAAQYLTGASAGASAASLGYANAVGFAGGDALSALYTANGGWAGVAAGAAGTAGAAATATGLAATAPGVSSAVAGAASGMGAAGAAGAASGASAGAAAGISAVGAAVPYIAAAVALYAIADSVFGGGGGPKTEVYGGSREHAGWGLAHSAPADSGLDALAAGTVAQFDAVLAQFGKSARLQLGIGGNADPHGDAPSETGYTLSVDGVERSKVMHVAELNGEALAIRTSQALIAALEATDINRIIDGYLDTVDVGALTADQSSGVVASILAFDTMSDALDRLTLGAGSSSDALYNVAEATRKTATDANGVAATESVIQSAARIMQETIGVSVALTKLGVDINSAFPADEIYGMSTALASLFGGIEGFNTSVAAYYENFFTAEEKTKNAWEDMGKAFSNLNIAMPTTREGFRDIVEGLRHATGEGQLTFKALMDLQGGFAALTSSADQLSASAQAASQAAAQAAEQAAKAVASERSDLQDQLDQLTMTSAQLLGKQRNALDESNRALFDQIQAITAAQVAEQAANDAKAAALDALKASTDDALAALSKSIEAEKSRIGVIRDVAAESVRSIAGIFDLLKDQVSQLYGSVVSTSVMQAAQGNAFIDQALSAAKSSGYLPDQQKLAAAIAGARGSLDESLYATQFEADRATLVMAGKLSQLQAVSGYQMSVAEQSLKVANDQLSALDTQLAYAQQQVDALNGINASVIGVGATMSSLTSAIAAQKAVSMIAASAAGAAASGTSSARAGSGVESATDLTPAQLLYYNAIKDQPGQGTAAGILAYVSALQDVQALDSYESVAGIASDPHESGDSVMARYGYRLLDPLSNDPKTRYSQLPGFATGINRVPYDMTARIHADEAIVPAEFNPFNPNARSSMSVAGNTERLERLVEALTSEVKHLQGIVSAGNLDAKRAANALNGQSEQPMLVETI